MTDRSAETETRPRVAVAICTYNRHGPLATLLEALLVNARHLGRRAAVGVVVVDDSSDGNARNVVEPFGDRFELGVAYRVSGHQNIALARNLALETAIGVGDWIAMTDDDCEPAPDWLETMLDVQRRTGADAVSGVLKRRVPPGAPRWLTDEPFLEVGLWEGVPDGAEVNSAATHNSMLSAAWLRDHPGCRFDPALGKTGGEDPVFYRTAHAAGLKIHFGRHGLVYENEPPSRTTLAYQFRMFFWFGNSSYITSVRGGARPLRMFLHGGKVAVGGFLRPVARLVRGQPPQLRFGMASVLRGLGTMAGFLGFQVSHK